MKTDFNINQVVACSTQDVDFDDLKDKLRQEFEAFLYLVEFNNNKLARVRLSFGAYSDDNHFNEF